MAVDLNNISRIARAHHGLFRFADAQRCGLSRDDLKELVARHWCDRPGRTVYRVVGAPETSAQATLAAVWFCGDDAVASHRAAANTWGVPGYGQSRPEVTKPRGQSQRRRYGLIHGSLWLPGAHRTERHQIPVTTPARSVFDLAGVVSVGRAEHALDYALRTRLCTIGQLHAVFFALARRGRRGTATMRQLLEARGSGYVPPASELERRARKLFCSAGLPEPEYEVEVADDSWMGRVDCLWRSARVIVELDRRRFHDGLSARRADRDRDNALMAAGWRVIRVTWDDLTDRPEEVIRWIVAALG